MDVSGASVRIALTNTITNGTKEGFRSLLAAGAKPDQALFRSACTAWRTGIVRELLAAGVQPDSYCSELTRTAFGGDTAALKELIGHGVQIDEEDRQGRTALMYACLAGHGEMVKTLIHSGSDVNMITTPSFSGKQTALMLAAAGGDVEICRNP